MKTLALCAAVAAVAFVTMAQAPAADDSAAGAAMVKPDGTIVMTTQDYQRDWAFLGTFAHPGDDGVKKFNVIYTQPETVSAYRETGEFPEGAVLIKELRGSEIKDNGGGPVASLGELTGWFVMIKPPKEGGPQGPLWGDGWGWAKFDVDAPDATISTDYQKDCIACHLPVKDTDWVHVYAFPSLHQ